MEAHDQGLMLTLGGDDKLFEVSWTLTPQVPLVTESLLDPFFPVRSLYDLAMVADASLGLIFSFSTFPSSR